MSKIVTLTLNPSVDKNTSTKYIKPEVKTRCNEPIFEPGGGGINVSRALHNLEFDSTAIFPVGGASGITLANLLEREGVESQAISCEEWTRENLNITDESSDNQYRFIMPGSPLNQSELDKILETILAIQDIGYLVVSGSTPPGVDFSFFQRLASAVKARGVKLIMDTSGETLKHALQEGIFMAKPNNRELAELAGKEDIEAIENVEALAKQIVREQKVEVLVISLGSQGALLVTEDIVEHLSAPLIKKKSTVGAGDSMVAGIVMKLAQGGTISEALRYGIACGSSATKQPGTQLCIKEDVEELYARILRRNPLKK